MGPKKFLPIVVVALVLAGAAYWVWQARDDSDPEHPVLYGNVDVHQVSLAFNASDRITELKAREGDKVHAGDVLGVLDTRTIRLKLAEAQAQLAIQEQALNKLKAGSRPEEIAKAHADVAAAEADTALAEKLAKRLQSVASASHGRGVSQEDLDNAAARLAVARARTESVRKAARLVELGPRAEDVALADKQVALARAVMATLQRQLDESELKAPVDAEVRARLLEPGDMASPQRPVYALAITTPKWVRAYVPETLLGRLKPGMKAEVSIDSDPEHPIPAQLGYIASVAEFTPKNVETPELRTSLVYEVRFIVDDRQDRLRLGMPATVRLQALASPGSAR